MRVRACLILLVIAGLLPAVISMPSCKKHTESCAVCEREVHEGMKAKLKVDGETKTTCCIACGMHFKETTSPAVLTTVMDFATGTELPPERASYVMGSDISGCASTPEVMRSEQSNAYLCYDNCRPSILAFARMEDARKLQQDHGGKLITYDQVLNLFHKSRDSHSH